MYKCATSSVQEKQRGSSVTLYFFVCRFAKPVINIDTDIYLKTEQGESSAFLNQVDALCYLFVFKL